MLKCQYDVQYQITEVIGSVNDTAILNSFTRIAKSIDPNVLVDAKRVGGNMWVVIIYAPYVNNVDAAV